MDLSEVVAITGMPGLHKIIAKRPDGMIISDFGSDSRKFISSRIHMFTTLDNITIYTDDDSVPLNEVFDKMLAELDSTPLVSGKASNAELRGYFTAILPDHDQEKVYHSDIKKIIKWFSTLHANQYFDAESSEAAADVPSSAKSDQSEEE